MAVADLIAHATRVVADRAAAGGVAVDTDVAPDLPDLEADPLRLEQALVNLLANAVRHTPAGGRVEVVSTRHRDEVTAWSRPTAARSVPARDPTAARS